MKTQQITESTVLRAVSDERSKLTDKEIFTSAGYKRLVHSIGKEVTGRTGRAKELATVEANIVWEPTKDALTAYTDNKKIVVNAAHDFVQAAKLRYDRHLCVIGAAGHEFAHCLFTDFDALKEQHHSLMDGKFYPSQPVTTAANRYGLEEMQKWMDKGIAYRRFLHTLYAALDNSIEDAYIERSLVAKFPGIFKKALKTINESLFSDPFKTEIKPQDAWSEFTNLLLVSIKLGSITFEAEPVGLMAELKGRVEALAPRLKRDVWNSNMLTRKKLVLDLMLENWDLLDLSFGSLQEQQGGGSGGEFSLDDLTPEELEELVKAIIGALMNGETSQHDNNNRPNTGKPIKILIDQPPQNPSQDGTDNGEGNDSSGQGGVGQDGDQGPKGQGVGDQDDDSTKQSKNSDASSDNEPSSGENGAEPLAKADDTLSSGAETTVVVRIIADDQSGNGNDELRDALAKVEIEVAQAQAEKNVNDALKKMLQQNANESRSQGDKVSIFVERDAIPPETGAKRYRLIWPELQYYARQLKKELLKILKSRRAGGKVSGLSMGRRVNSRQLHREDECYFSRNKLPDDRPRVAVSILIDESGSMQSQAMDSSGKGLFESKIQAASNAALLLYDFCVTLGFPVMVAGHTTTCSGVLMRSMATFQRLDLTDRFRIANATASGGNRDGTALNYCLCELKKRSEEVKLLFILSDGLPSDYSSRKAGIEHLKEVTKAAKAAHVELYAAALDEDVEAIKNIYGERAFEMTDLARMPKSLIAIIKKYIK